MKKRAPQSREKWVLVPTKEKSVHFNYYFSNYGQMKSVNKVTEAERFLKGSKGKYGFIQLNLRLANNKRASLYLHRLIAMEFLPIPPEEKKFIIHIDGDKLNNYFKNLKWVDRDELTAYHAKLGVYDSTTKNGIQRYKLNETKVKLIKKRLKSKRTKREIIARDFGISLPHLICIEKGQYWGDVEI